MNLWFYFLQSFPGVQLTHHHSPHVCSLLVLLFGTLYWYSVLCAMCSVLCAVVLRAGALVLRAGALCSGALCSTLVLCASASCRCSVMCTMCSVVVLLCAVDHDGAMVA